MTSFESVDTKSIKSSLISPKDSAQEEYWNAISNKETEIAKNQRQLQRTDISSEERQNILKKTRKLLCDKIRLQRPAILTNPVLNKNTELRELATRIFWKEFEQNRQGFIDSLPPEVLLSLEAISPWTLAKFYAFKESTTEDGTLIVENINLATITQNERIFIDFGNNLTARAIIPDDKVIPDTLKVNIVQ